MIRRRTPFLEKLAASMRARDSILCIGLDPEPALIPGSLGRGPQAALRFLRRIVRATSDYACCYKPNLAFYERYGSAAFDVLGLTLQAIPSDIPYSQSRSPQASKPAPRRHTCSTTPAVSATGKVLAMANTAV